MNALLQHLDHLTLFVLLVIANSLFVISGFWLGKKRRQQTKSSEESLRLHVEGYLSSFLVLLLSFTFAMSAGREEIRRTILVEEQEAIDHVRMSLPMLSSPDEEKITQLLDQYVVLVQGTLTEPPSFLHRQQLRHIQNQLWQAIIKTSVDYPPPSSNAPFFNWQAVSEMFLLHSKREVAFQSSIPDLIMFFLITASFLTLSLTGYSWGIRESYHLIPALLFAVMVALGITVIIDLDNPRWGVSGLNVRQTSLSEEFS